MNSVIITVAGTATRFNRDTATPTLKCLYYEQFPEQTLLYGIMERSNIDDHFVIVGGYLYEKLQNYIELYCGNFINRISLVYNEKFDTYGSGYSLIKGIEAIPEQTNEITFVEGDLFFDKSSYNLVLNAKKDVITVNNDPIEASKAVAVVVDKNNHPLYLYDTKHEVLVFNEPFKAIYNSAQIWKFNDIARLKNVIDKLSQKQLEGTNLEIVGGYFTPMSCNDIEIIKFASWCNCNTVSDYQSIYKK